METPEQQMLGGERLVTDCHCSPLTSPSHQTACNALDQTEETRGEQERPAAMIDCHHRGRHVTLRVGRGCCAAAGAAAAARDRWSHHNTLTTPTNTFTQKRTCFFCFVVLGAVLRSVGTRSRVLAPVPAASGRRAVLRCQL